MNAPMGRPMAPLKWPQFRTAKIITSLSGISGDSYQPLASKNFSILIFDLKSSGTLSA